MQTNTPPVTRLEAALIAWADLLARLNIDEGTTRNERTAATLAALRADPVGFRRAIIDIMRALNEAD